jgi:hypothetical protein
MVVKLYYKGQPATSMDVLDTDIEYWKNQGWLAAPATQTPLQTTAPIVAPTAPAAPAVLSNVPKPSPEPVPITQAKPTFASTPIKPGEKEALINKYLQGGFTLQEATKRVNELWAQRPEIAPTQKPTEYEFAPTKEKLSTAVAAPTKIEPTEGVTKVTPELVAPETDFTTQINQLMERYGIKPSDTGVSPVNEALETYKTVYKELGLPDVRTEFDKVQKQYADLQMELADKISDVNDNPWLTEGMRRARINSLQERYEQKTASLTQQMALYQNVYESGQRQAQYVLEQAAQARQTQEALRTSLFLKAVEQAEKMMQPTEYPAAIQEYLFAKEQGYAGDYVDFKADKKSSENLLLAQQVLKDPQILTQLTPSTRSDILNELANSGIDVSYLARQYGDLTEKQRIFIDKYSSEFKNEATVKNFQVVAEGFDFAQSLIDDKGRITSSDDQGLIYAFAKAMDPNSVVREGEYRTVQNYAQSWAEKFGFDVKRIASNTPFLTQEARENMVTTIQKKFNASERAYTNIYSEYSNKIDDLLERKNIGGQYLIDYSKPYQFGMSPEKTQDVAKQLNVSSEEIQEAIDAGYTIDQIKQLIPKDEGGSTSLRVKLPGGQIKEGGSASWRNNNPLNIKYGSFAGNYGAIKGSVATDGGNFAAFPSESTGLKAAKDLLKSSGYKNLSLEAAMRRWSGKGYGAEVAPTQLHDKKISQMTDSELNQLIQAMRKREGYTVGSLIG